MNRRAAVLATTPVVECLLRSQPCTVPRKQQYRILQVLACTCKTLHNLLHKHTQTWVWAKRRSVMLHALHKWRHYRWLRAVPFWTQQFRHATDEWFSKRGPARVGDYGTCRVDPAYFPRMTSQTRVLWIERNEPSTPWTMAERFTATNPISNTAVNGYKRVTVRVSRHADFVVAAHVYSSGGQCIDASVKNASYAFGGGTRRIGAGQWRDAQRCYIPTLLAAFMDIELQFDVDQHHDDIVVAFTGFFLDGTTHDDLRSRARVVYPFDRMHVFVARDGLLSIYHATLVRAGDGIA